METIIFTDKVKRLANEPIDNPYTFPSLNDTSVDYTDGLITIEQDTTYNYTDAYTITDIITIKDLTKNVLIQEFSNYNDTKIYNDVKNDRDAAIDRRELKNNKLFIATMEYWIAITFGNILFYFLIKHYKSIKKLEKMNGTTTVSTMNMDEESFELVEINTYRRRSIDDDDEPLETNQNDIKKKKMIKVCNLLLHYLLFAVCLVSFQYMFFKNVILVYDPLSIEEVKYIVYNLILPKIREEQDKIITNV
jgi:hypothetical protein